MPGPPEFYNRHVIERVRTALDRRPPIGVAISVLLHVALILLLFWAPAGHRSAQKRGDALIVELPNEPSGKGMPGPSPDAPIPAPPRPKAPVRPATPSPRPTPPAARQTPKSEPRQAPRAVASAPQPPPSSTQGDVPAAKSAPQPEAVKPAAEKPAAEKPATETAQAAPEPTPVPRVAAVPSPPGPVAMVPPSPPDIRSAMRRGGGGGGIGPGGAGGSGVGRGGIIGEPIPLDSKDPDFSDYLERVRQLIKRNWGYPCVKNTDTRECEYKSARLVVDFGILRQGPVQFVEVRQASGWSIYDDYAVNAIKLASPFPPVPAGLMARLERGTTGIPIRVNFTYMLESSLTNVR
jgi:TonB family protein